jgi:hypothetical protein
MGLFDACKQEVQFGRVEHVPQHHCTVALEGFDLPGRYIRQL